MPRDELPIPDSDTPPRRRRARGQLARLLTRELRRPLEPEFVQHGYERLSISITRRMWSGEPGPEEGDGRP